MLVLGSYNHKELYPEKGACYEPTGSLLQGADAARGPGFSGALLMVSGKLPCCATSRPGHLCLLLRSGVLKCSQAEKASDSRVEASEDQHNIFEIPKL